MAGEGRVRKGEPMGGSEKEAVEICRRICSLADELRDIWLRRLSRRKMREVMALTVSQKRMFRTVWRETQISPQGIMLKELAAKLSLSSSAASVMVDAMVKNGIFERVTDDSDRRRVFIRVSAAGTEQARTHIEGVAAGSWKFFSGLAEAQLRVFSGVLEQFQQFLITSQKESEK